MDVFCWREQFINAVRAQDSTMIRYYLLSDDDKEMINNHLDNRCWLVKASSYLQNAFSCCLFSLACMPTHCCYIRPNIPDDLIEEYIEENKRGRFLNENDRQELIFLLFRKLDKKQLNELSNEQLMIAGFGEDFVNAVRQQNEKMIRFYMLSQNDQKELEKLYNIRWYDRINPFYQYPRVIHIPSDLVEHYTQPTRNNHLPNQTNSVASGMHSVTQALDKFYSSERSGLIQDNKSSYGSHQN